MIELKINKRGNILTENIIFIILNLIFLIILILFLFSRIGSAAVLEEKYAKQIALLIDSAEPVMTITLKMDDASEEIENGKWSFENVVSIKDSIVTVKLREKGGYSYSFFNDVDATAYPKNDKEYFLIVNAK